MGIKSRLCSAVRLRLGRGSIRADLRRRMRSSEKLGELAWVAIKAIGQKIAAATPSIAPPAPPKPALPRNLDLFWFDGLDDANANLLSELKAERIRYACQQRNAKRRQRERVKGLQYKMRLEVRKTERKLRFARKAAREIGGNTEHFPMRWIRRLHAWVLRDALDHLRECLEVGSSRAAEVWAWIERPGTEDEFSFETCLRIASEFPEVFDDLGEEFLQMDPDEVRKVFGAVVRKRFGAVFPHRRLLKEAIVEAELCGNEDAIRWITSTADTPLSFVDCCNALGFDPDDARQSILLPHTEGQLALVAA